MLFLFLVFYKNVKYFHIISVAVEDNKKPLVYVIASFYTAFSGKLKFSFWYDLRDCNAAEHYTTESSIMLCE